ncbi:hypothetical protein WJX77_011659 [Trebouxia sp. C0004]
MPDALPTVISQPLQTLAANPVQTPAAGPPVGSIAALLLLLTGLAIWRFTAYGRLQYITAAMLGRWIPKGGARVIQVGGGSRDLYYYPKDTVLVTVMSPKLKKGLMGQAAIQAGVPVDVRLETPTHLSFQGNSSVEAVVCLQSLHTLPDLPRFLAETQRVLKPGAPFIFLQAVKADGLSSAAQLLLGGARKVLDLSALENIKEMSGFESVEWDIALSGQNPHAIGVAVKAGSDRESDEREVAFEQRANKSSRNKRKSVKAGFGKSV